MTNALCIGIACLALIVATFAIVYSRRMVKRTFDSIRAMLTLASSGDFTESAFDESLLSATETSFADYLSACAVSSKNLAEEKNKVKMLISDISHQTKTPLSNILLYSQLLSEHDMPEQSAQCVQSLTEQAEKLRFLIDALVKASRLETGVIALAPIFAPLQPLLDGVHNQIAPKAHAKNITLTFAPTTAIARYDIKWTAEALYNIVDNAVKYTQAGGVVAVSAVSYELFCRIMVRDNGIGIAEEEHAKIFSRFYRSPMVNTAEGIGVGLFLTREIATEQGGYVKVASQQGKGALFSLYLPREA